MATLHKTFVDNEYPDAEQFNDALNPTTADHIPYAQAAGLAWVSFNANNVATVNVNFPANRFTQPPIVTVSPAGNYATVARPTGISAAGCTLTAWTPAGNNISENQPIHWHAVQMAPGSAAG